MVVTVDTGATHVASAMRRPTVVAFEHRYFRLNSQEWAPYGVPHVLVRKPLREDYESLSPVSRRNRGGRGDFTAMIECSVVIPTYNRLDTLQHVIPTLLAQDLAPDTYELLICDSNSNDGTAEYLATVSAEHPNVRHLPGPYSGRAAARNAGIAAAGGDVVLFNDSDILASPDLLSRHLARHRERPHIAVVGLEVQVKDLADYAYKRDHPRNAAPCTRHRARTYRGCIFLPETPRFAVPICCRPEFRREFTGYGHEDLELGYRLQKAA